MTKKKWRPLKFFYLNGKLHRSLYINRPGDIITTWSYPDEKRVGYTYSDVRRVMEPAFTTKQVCEMVDRARSQVEKAILNGEIEKPQIVYGMTEKRGRYKYMWHEKDIMALHAYLATVHYGRPRKDGIIKPKDMPSARELRAMIHQQPVMGYLDEEGNFVPTFLAKNI